MSGSIRRLFAALVMVGVTVGGSAGPRASGAPAQIPSADGVIHACVRIDRDADAGRVTRLVAAEEACRRNEIRVRWNVTGPTGPKGESGAPGTPGEHGETGLTGVQGTQGPPGVSAPAGAIAGQLASCVPGATLAGYLVHIPGRGFNAFTGADGAFQIDNIPPGTYDLSVVSGKVSVVIPQIVVTDVRVTLPASVQVATCVAPPPPGDTVAPTTPVATGILPLFPSSSLTPIILGQSEPGSTVRVYRTANCQGQVVGSTVVDPSGYSFSVTVPATSSSVSTYYLQASDAAFNLSQCSMPITYVHSPLPPACTPKTCAQVGANCGPVSDGCGGSISCGTCTGSFTCGGGGVPNVCAMPKFP